jgi:hypothetical protein
LSTNMTDAEVRHVLSTWTTGQLKRALRQITAEALKRGVKWTAPARPPSKPAETSAREKAEQWIAKLRRCGGIGVAWSARSHASSFFRLRLELLAVGVEPGGGRDPRRGYRQVRHP